jgi:hypothetical protein
MRTYDALVGIGLIGFALGFSPASSFDGTPTDEGAKGPSLQSRESVRTPAPSAIPAAPMPPAPAGVLRPPASIPQSGAAAAKRLAPPTAGDALRSGTQALRDGKTDQAVTSLEYAAEQGAPGALWKLGRMYADGDGVSQNKLRAFEYFKNLTKAHADDPPGTPQARFVASAFVSLGHFYLEGIPDSAVKADPVVAREMFHYAASYFGDPEAQYYLGRIFLNGTGTAKDGRAAARWFRLAADKGHRSAQAMLGSMLFKGQGISRQSAMGLAWLAIAKEGASADEAWIAEMYKSAYSQASQDERALAYRYLEELVSNRRQPR